MTDSLEQPPERKMNSTQQLQKIEQESKKLEAHIVPKTGNKVDDSQILEIIEIMSAALGLPSAATYIAIKLLFLKGAASAASPESLSVEIITDKTGTTIPVFKRDLVYSYKKVTNNTYIRKLAEALATPISTFAESRGLDGEIAQQINKKLIARGDPPLNKRQKAWCSSFNQQNELMEKDEELKIVLSLLVQDYHEKFRRKREATPSSNKNKSTSSPRPKGKPNKNKKLFAKTTN